VSQSQLQDSWWMFLWTQRPSGR